MMRKIYSICSYLLNNLYNLLCSCDFYLNIMQEETKKTIYDQYLKNMNLYKSDMKLLKENFELKDLLNDITFSRNEIIDFIKSDFSYIFVVLVKFTSYKDDIFKFMENMEKKKNIYCIAYKKFPSNEKIKSLCKNKKNINIIYEKMNSLNEGWILIDEECKLIDESCAFLNLLS